MSWFSDFRQEMSSNEINWLLHHNAPSLTYRVYGELARKPLVEVLTNPVITLETANLKIRAAKALLSCGFVEEMPKAVESLLTIVETLHFLTSEEHLKQAIILNGTILAISHHHPDAFCERLKSSDALVSLIAAEALAKIFSRKDFQKISYIVEQMLAGAYLPAGVSKLISTLGYGPVDLLIAGTEHESKEVREACCTCLTIIKFDHEQDLLDALRALIKPTNPPIQFKSQLTSRALEFLYESARHPDPLVRLRSASILVYAPNYIATKEFFDLLTELLSDNDESVRMFVLRSMSDTREQRPVVSDSFALAVAGFITHHNVNVREYAYRILNQIPELPESVLYSVAVLSFLNPVDNSARFLLESRIDQIGKKLRFALFSPSDFALHYSVSEAGEIFRRMHGVAKKILPPGEQAIVTQRMARSYSQIFGHCADRKTRVKLKGDILDAVPRSTRNPVFREFQRRICA